METELEAALVAGMRRGNLEDGDALLAHYRPRVFSYLVRMTDDRHVAEDLLQDTFLRVWNGRHTLRDPRAFRYWLFEIARNVARDWLRRVSRSPEILAADPAAGLEHREDPEAIYQGLALAGRIERFVRDLTLEQREVFLLRMHSPLSFDEIAGLTGVPRSTAISRMHYAVNKLRDAVSAGPEESS